MKWIPFTPPAPPACRFLKLYGRRFSKEDHVLFIKLLYELVTLPELEPHMVQSFARLLIQLLKWVGHAEHCATSLGGRPG